MNAIEKIAEAAIKDRFGSIQGRMQYGDIYQQGVMRGLSIAQEWISITQELPECKHIDETEDEFSDYVLVKIMGYEHPFIAFYSKIGTNEGFDLVHLSVDKTTDKKAITHWRPIERI